MAIIAAGDPETGAPALSNSQGHCQCITGHSGLLETDNQHPACSKWVSGPRGSSCVPGHVPGIRIQH